jgi:hypothetical protein
MLCKENSILSIIKAESDTAFDGLEKYRNVEKDYTGSLSLLL